jgi:hypothetical protein
MGILTAAVTGLAIAGGAVIVSTGALDRRGNGVFATPFHPRCIRRRDIEVP